MFLATDSVSLFTPKTRRKFTLSYCTPGDIVTTDSYNAKYGLLFSSTIVNKEQIGKSTARLTTVFRWSAGVTGRMSRNRKLSISGLLRTTETEIVNVNENIKKHKATSNYESYEVIGFFYVRIPLIFLVFFKSNVL